MKTRMLTSGFAFVFMLSLLCGNAKASSAVDESEHNISAAIVKVFTVSTSNNYYVPWASSQTTSGQGSGCIISSNRILTNAHVVSDQTFIQVVKNSETHKYTARVLAISHDADLAILTVDDTTFFEGVVPLNFGELPNIQDEVRVYGYPIGGNQLSVTKGIISRIENVNYAHSGKNYLAGQVDAAINPGNSGGPVIVAGKIAGIVMQGWRSAQSIGYFVPTPVVLHFLEDIADGQYDGYPVLGVRIQNIENNAMSERYGVSRKQSGILVNSVSYGSKRYCQMLGMAA